MRFGSLWYVDVVWPMTSRPSMASIGLYQYLPSHHLVWDRVVLEFSIFCSAAEIFMCWMSLCNLILFDLILRLSVSMEPQALEDCVLLFHSACNRVWKQFKNQPYSCCMRLFWYVPFRSTVLSSSQIISRWQVDAFNFWVVCSATVGEMSCYVTIDATGPNIAAIRGLALGLGALVRLSFTVAHHWMSFASVCLRPLCTIVYWHRDSFVWATLTAETTCMTDMPFPVVRGASIWGLQSSWLRLDDNLSSKLAFSSS